MNTYQKGVKMDIIRSRGMAVLTGTVMAYAITCIVFIGYAVLITYTVVSEAQLPFVVILTTLVSVAVSGFDSARGADSRGWLWGIAAGLIYAVILFAVGAWIFKGFMFNLQLLALLAVSLGGGAIGGAIGINTGGKGKK